jgi:hypothetical protein
MKPCNKLHFFPFAETWKKNFMGGAYVDHSVLKVSWNLQQKLHSGLLALVSEFMVTSTQYATKMKNRDPNVG